VDGKISQWTIGMVTKDGIITAAEPTDENETLCGRWHLSVILIMHIRGVYIYIYHTYISYMCI